MNRSGVKERRNDAAISPEDDEYEENEMAHRNFVNKARAPIRSFGDISHKRGAVSFNLGRIVPKNIAHDKEYLYEQNIKLKQSVKQFQNQLVKLKTRLLATEKQKLKIVDQFNHGDMPLKRESSRIVKRNSNTNPSSIQNQNYMKKMLRETKDQTAKLKSENMKLKRTVKYTQINELNIQNKYLFGELSRLNSIIESKVLDQNEGYQQLHRKIEDLKQDLQQERQNSKKVNGQLKKKNQQIEELRSKVVQLSTKEKRSRKDFDDFKKAVKDEKFSKTSKKSIKNEEYLDESGHCQKCEQLKKKLKLYKQIGQKNNNTYSKDKKSINAKSENKNSQSHIDVNTQISKSTLKKSENKKIQKEEKKQQKEEDYEQKFQNAEYQDNQTSAKQMQQSKKEQEKKESMDQYEEEFENVDKELGESSDKQQVIFKKQDKNKRSEKQILSETITYRMMCQKYSFKDLTSDIKQSNMKQFTVEQIATMLNDQPFYLNQQQLQLLISHIFGQDNNLDLQDKVKAKDFLKKIKEFVQEFQEISEEKEDMLIEKSFSTLKKNLVNLTKQLEEQAKKNGGQTVTKEQFTKILKEHKLSSEEISVIICQVAMISTDIDSINYQQFLSKLNE